MTVGIDVDEESLLASSSKPSIRDLQEMTWSEFMSDKWQRLHLLCTFFAAVFVYVTFSQVIEFVENRQGVQLPDPVLSMFEPMDLSVVIFVVLYASMILYLSDAMFRPRTLIRGFQAFGVMLCFRMITMLLTPLEAPHSILVLRDPWLQIWFRVEKDYTKDLFFSGHTSTLYLMYLNSRSGCWRRPVLLSTTVIVAACLLAQHVHYTIDVLAAPFFTMTSHMIIQWLDSAIFSRMPATTASKPSGCRV